MSSKTPVVHIRSEVHRTTHTICGVRITEAVKLVHSISTTNQGVVSIVSAVVPCNLCGSCRRLWPAEHLERARRAKP